MSEANALFEEARQVAIKFYDNEHDLNSEQRREVSTFFKGTTSTIVNLSAIGFVSGVALPFILKKKGQVVNPIYPVFFGFVLSSFIPAAAAVPLYDRRLGKLRDTFGEQSDIYKAVENTPAPISKSYFWTGYFNKSSVDPNYRFADPRKLESGQTVLVIERTPVDATAYTYSTPTPNPNPKNPELSSAWDKVRNPSPKQTAEPAYNYNTRNSGSMLDSGLDLDGSPAPSDSNAGQQNRITAWDKVRQQNGTK